MQKSKTIVRLTESAMLIAVASILSLAKLVRMPAGGSVTIASMLPLIIIAYRYGTGWGLLSGLTYGLVQFVLGVDNIGALPVKDFASVTVLILADYLVAFSVLGLGGVFRKVCKKQATALALGAVLVSVLRYLCHVISGWTVWAQFLVSADGLKNSLTYNSFMLPEMLILVYAAIYLGNALDFRGSTLRPMAREEQSSASNGLLLAAGALLVFAVSFDTVQIFSKMQKDDGVYSFVGLANVDWLIVGIITALCLVGAVALLLLRRSLRKKERAAE